MRPSLSDPRAKLDRAGEHLDTLGIELRAFSEREPHAIVPDDGLDEGWKVLRIRVREEPPVKLGLIFGDFVHNLRSALDNLVCQLARLGGADNCDRTQFPICDTAQQFSGQVSRGRLAGLSDEHITAIELLQPRPGRNLHHYLALTALRDFDNIDKHQAIHAAVIAVDPRPEAMRARRARTDSEVAFEIEPVTIGKPLYEGAIVARVRIVSGSLKPNMGMEFEFPLRMGFGEHGLVEDKLPAIWRLVQEIVESFAPAFDEAAHGDPQDR